MAMRSIGMAMGVALALAAGGCFGPRVEYGDPLAASPLSTDFGASDLQQFTAAMVDSLLAFPAVVKMTADRRPVLVVARVRNKTMQHIDTEAITDSIRTRLIRSGKFQFIDRSMDPAVMEELVIQHEGGQTDPARAVALGRQVGAEYILYANLTQMDERLGNRREVYYKLTMMLRSVETGLLPWSDEKEIRKVATRRWVGR